MLCLVCHLAPPPPSRLPLTPAVACLNPQCFWKRLRLIQKGSLAILFSIISLPPTVHINTLLVMRINMKENRLSFFLLDIFMMLSIKLLISFCGDFSFNCVSFSVWLFRIYRSLTSDWFPEQNCFSVSCWQPYYSQLIATCSLSVGQLTNKSRGWPVVN